jgi:hypothetical protein
MKGCERNRAWNHETMGELNWRAQEEVWERQGGENGGDISLLRITVLKCRNKDVWEKYLKQKEKDIFAQCKTSAAQISLVSTTTPTVPLILFPFLYYPHTILVSFPRNIHFLVYPEYGECILFQNLSTVQSALNGSWVLQKPAFRRKPLQSQGSGL